MTSVTVNKSRQLKYYDLVEHREFDYDYEKLAKRIRSADYDQYIKSNGESTECGVINSLLGIVPLPAKSIWTIRDNSLKFEGLIELQQQRKACNVETIKRIASQYIGAFNERTLAIELSGGLDTSIIISLFEECGENPYLIGIRSSRYEFRTERLIQEKYGQRHANSLLIAQDDVLPFSELIDVPPHPIPDTSSLFIKKHKMMSAAAFAAGAKHLLNGNTGDNLLCLNPIENRNIERHRLIDGWSISAGWANKFIYNPMQVEYISVFFLNQLFRALLHLRRNEAEDHMTLWARNYFRSILPTELVTFAYKASHEAWIAEGINRNTKEIIEICNITSNKLKIPELASRSLAPTLSRFIFLDPQEQALFYKKLSFATWFYGYVREGYL